MPITAGPAPASSASPAFAPAAPRLPRSGGQRVAIWLGSVVALFGALLALSGGGALAVFGADGVASTGRHALVTPTSALVSGTASIDTGGFVDGLGSARVRMSADAVDGRRIFIGVGRTADVDRYLAGAATDEVRDLDVGPFESSFDVRTERHPGSVIPAMPGRQRFWIAQSSGAGAAAVDWKVRDGDYRVVVMNADGSRGVATESEFSVDVPYLPGISLGILVLGLVLTAGGIASIAAGARRSRG